MSAKINYHDEPIGDVEIVEDFLPPPEALIPKDDTVKVTMSLSRASVEFFKAEARKHHTQYQKMIRQLLDLYARAHQHPAADRSASRQHGRR